MFHCDRSRFQEFLLTGWMVLFACAGYAQQYLLETGAPTFATPEPVPNGFINVANGNLHIEIPFVSTPQRGGQAFIAKMVYDSRVWKIVDNGSSQSWQHTNEGSGWKFLTTAQPSYGYDQIAHVCNGTYTWYEYKNYRFNDINGTARRFPLYYETSNSCHTAASPTTSGPALDASGRVMNIDPNASFQPYTPREVIGSDGTKVLQYLKDQSDPYSPPINDVIWRDTNGNIMKRVTGTPGAFADYIKDTLDRTVVETTYATSEEMDYAFSSSGTFKVFYSALGVSTYFDVSGVTENMSSIWLVSEIDLPDGTAYQFTYDVCDQCSVGEGKYGLLKTMTLPTGETIEFAHSNFTDAQGNMNRWVTAVSKGGGTWTVTPATCSSGCDQKVTVARPSGDEAVYNFTLNNGAWNKSANYYTGSASTGTLALKVERDYDMSRSNPIGSGNAFILPTRTTTTWPGAAPSGSDLVLKVESDYDSFTYTYQGTNYTDGSHGNVTEHREYAYGSDSAGSLARKQVYTYLSDSNYIAKNIVNRVTNVQTKNAAGTKIAETITTYDSTSITSVTGITHHDDTNFGTSYTLRGNPTVIQNWTGSGTSYLESTLTYDMTGQVVSTLDPMGNQTQFSYADNFYQENPPATNAYVTQVTFPPISGVSNTLHYRYFYGSGLVYQTTDQNSQVTSHSYDILGRPTGTSLPGGGWTTGEYNSATQSTYTTSLFETTTGQTQLTLDSLGRPRFEWLITDPQGQTVVERTYDTSGRVATVTNPYRSGSDPTYGVTTYQYDGLNRVKKTTLPDNNFTEAFFGSGVGAAGGRTTQLCSSGTYGLGYPVLSKDEAGKKRQVWTDALGRLIEADEPDSNGSLTSEYALGTCYKYDIFGNLTQVDQGSQTRTFSYDALSRLTTETTPEAGTVNYYYTTSGGGLCAGSPSALCRSTDARSITTTYTYDAENRLTGKSYSNSDPAVSYLYDQTSYNGLTITYGLGRRTGMSDASGQTAWSYNVDGGVVAERRTIAGITKSISYSYNLNGSLYGIAYPSGLTAQHIYDTAGRLKDIVCGAYECATWNNQRYFAKSATYGPHGALASLVLGWVPDGFAGITNTYTYNTRLQPVNMKATHTSGTVTVLDFTYSFVASSINDGQVKSVTNNVATGRSQAYTYDEMNRLASAQSQATSGPECWGQIYSYDRYANLTSIALDPAKNGQGCGAPTLNLGISSTTNRITNTGFSYDAGGNLLADGFSSYIWNAEGRMDSTAGYRYIYDGDGRRVAKVAGGHGRGATGRNPSGQTHNSNEKLYWYGISGEVLAESDLGGNVTAEYIYFSGQRIARRTPSGTVHYYLADRLGSARVMVNSTGGVVEESDFYPYGTERVITDTLDNPYKFTGHERDAESGLDHTLHRQYASTTGRWHSPDPARGKPANPQSWNRYAYVSNNPCNATDPLGDSEHFPPWPEHFNPPPGWIPVWHYNPKVVDDMGPSAEDFWNTLPGPCRGGLSEAHPDDSIYDKLDALDRAWAAGGYLRVAATPHGMDWRMLAAIGIRESQFGDPKWMIQSNGPGRGIFGIEAGPGGSHEGRISVEDAMAMVPAAAYAAHYLDRIFEQISKAFPGLTDQATLIQATAASWNRGAQGVINDINNGLSIDSNTNRGNYGSNIMDLMQCFPE